ncbi:putative bifunctional diguanylate cyclase/phosphodiesterase [Devosia alba]|uniref:putative bifunctional diguanylate cyclase/phosphodiesterase n=1 Tax=Devosia alba TaxID=3152360 RepID=UPI0032634A12
MVFQDAHKILPPVDYVSMIRSLYQDRRSMLLGAFGSALAAAVAALEAGSVLLGVFVGLFILVGLLRYADMRAFEAAELSDTDVQLALHWEIRATVGAAAIALVYGTWCLVSFWLIGDAFAELTAASVSVSVLVGVSQRNFAIDRLMTIQVLLIAVPLALGLLLVGNLYYALLTLLLLPFFASLRGIAGNARDILLRAVHGRIAASQLASQLDTALTTLEHGLLMLDSDCIIEVANGRALDAFDLGGADGWVGRPASDLFDVALANSSMPQAAYDQLRDLINTRASGKLLLAVDPYQYFEISVSSRRTKTVLLFEDVSTRIIAEERIAHMARHDELTGLSNRAHFSEQVKLALRKRRTKGKPVHAALWIVDVDDFKHINDTMGHIAGDAVLAELGRRLPRAFGAPTICARLGGDEFIAFRADGASPEVLAEQSQRVFTILAADMHIPDRKLAVDVSIGLVISDNPDDDLDNMMVKADLAISAAKSGGKAMVVQFHDQMDTDYRLRQQLKADLKQAIADDQVTLVYQAVIDPRQDKIVGCEALARWNHPEHGQISPAVFIPIAEETGMITDLTRAVLAKATRDCSTWPDDICVAVNISARDFRASDVEAIVTDALKHSGLAAHRLEIEVTETAVIEEQQAATVALAALCARGIGVALDDFGTGYSSLSYLQSLPLTKLKIDRSFVMEITTNPQALRLLANVAQLGKDLDLKVTVEGVETEEQLNLLLSQTRIDQIQGFVYGQPLDLEAMTCLLRTRCGAKGPAMARPATAR